MNYVLICAVVGYFQIANALYGRHRKGDTEETGTGVASVCNQKTQGIARIVSEGQNLSTGCEVTLVLDRDALRVLKGNDDLKSFPINNLNTPVLIKTNECLSVQNDSEENLLCFSNKYSLDSWWMAITKQILCNNQGAVRNDVYGEASLEQMQADAELLSKDDDKKGISIHIDGKDASKLPQIKVHYRE